MGLFKSQEQKWAEAKKAAHERRADAGLRVNKRLKTYTDTAQIADQHRVTKASNKGRKTK